VVYNLQRVRGKLVLVEPKTEESRRTIGLPPAVVQALLDHRQRQRNNVDVATVLALPPETLEAAFADLWTAY
jgi:hypothetical protein